jgi:hypothetical protein
MLQSIKKHSWVVFLAGGLLAVWGFVPIGPGVGGGTGGDSWQVRALGYGEPGDVGTPKNINEEYRRNTPVMYYSFDANYSGFFGSNGVAAVDGAYAILNSLTNVSSYSSSLSEFPLDSEHYNPTAYALQLTDVKSVALGIMAEQLGLANSVRYIWDLRGRITTPACPLGSTYLVVQRNLDTTTSPLTQVQYSPYVNGVLYSYVIDEGCAAGAVAVPFSVDPFAQIYTPVSSLALDNGYFYNSLTRDDVAGLRYLLSSNNINVESPATGSVRLLTNSSPNVTLTTLSLGDLIAQSKTNPPATLEANFPGLITGDSTNFFVLEVTTNISFIYTNEPGPSITNYQPVQQNSLITTLDLGLFTAQAATNGPAQLTALYPGLVIVSSNAYFTNIFTPNLVTTFKSVNGAPAGTFKAVITTNGFTETFPMYFHYVFGNIYTNSYYSNSFVTIQTTAVSTPVGSAAGTVGVTNTTTTKILTHFPTGDLFIMPTNWCGFKVVQTFPPQIAISTSNTVTLSNVVSGVSQIASTQTTFTGYTNHTFVVEPGVCEPALFAVTNYTTNIVVQFQTDFLNIVTNSYFSNSTVTVTTTNIGACTNNGVDGTLCTNITTKLVIETNVPSGDFFIPPANWCGYTILSTLQTNFVATTNTVVATIPAGITDIGQQFSVTTISGFTNHTFLIAPLTCTAAADAAVLREGIENIKFVKVNFDSLLTQLFQPITNLYTMVTVSNSQASVRYYRRVITAPDFLFTAVDQSAIANFSVITRNLNFNQANVLPGLAGPGTINPTTTISWNKSTPVFENAPYTFIPVAETNFAQLFAWGSFDDTTNDPVVYPDGTSIQNIENQVLIQITLTLPDGTTTNSLPDGTNNLAYATTTISTTGGSFQPPFTWNLATGSGPLPQGLTFTNSATVPNAGELSGTPVNNPPGTYDFVIQMNDSLNPPRKVQWNYSINIIQ